MVGEFCLPMTTSELWSERKTAMLQSVLEFTIHLISSAMYRLLLVLLFNTNIVLIDLLIHILLIKVLLMKSNTLYRCFAQQTGITRSVQQ